MIELLRSRGFEVKSSSSTIDNISAESLVDEFANKNPVEEPKGKEAEPIEEVKGSAEKMAYQKVRLLSLRKSLIKRKRRKRVRKQVLEFTRFSAKNAAATYKATKCSRCNSSA